MATTIEIKMDGLNDLLRNIDVTKDITQAATAAAMALVSADVANSAKQNHSFQNQTGNLENSIQPLPVEITDNQVIGTVQAGMEYAPYVEFGTAKSAPYPFLQPAVEANKQKLLDTVSESVNRAMKTIKVAK